MSIRQVVIILGKRLQNNALTLEGKTRVEGLVSFLQHTSLKVDETALMFCGGITDDNTRSEARVMYDDYLELLIECEATSELGFPESHIILEEQSTNTVQNIQNGAKMLVSSGLIAKGGELDVIFVSNDYHLKRIFEIQTLLDEQGLLRLLQTRCQQEGVTVNISLDTEDHVLIPYPHHGLKANLFLLMDELTTYRVYLEGVCAQVFERPLSNVIVEPKRRALSAIKHARTDIQVSPAFDWLYQDLETLEQCVVESDENQPLTVIRKQLARLHPQLTQLNRELDPETQ